jgi:hypothetical protein
MNLNCSSSKLALPTSFKILISKRLFKRHQFSVLFESDHLPQNCHNLVARQGACSGNDSSTWQASRSPDPSQGLAYTLKNIPRQSSSALGFPSLNRKWCEVSSSIAARRSATLSLTCSTAAIRSFGEIPLAHSAR